MKGDFTRSTFNPKKHYTSVRMQQGRLQLDADWNEQVDIQAHLNQVQIQDLIGLSGVPKNENNEQNFKIIPVPGAGDFKIAPGHIYVDGILCQLEKEITYTKQPDYPNALQNDLRQEELQEGDYIAYLDVWQRHITSVDDPQIREVALGNVPDTATRTKTVCQVKLRQVNDIEADENGDDFFPKPQDRDITLTPKVSDGANLENHLYRIEIHKGVETEKQEGETEQKEATFKWSRDNGFIVSAIETIDGNILTVSQNNDEAWQLARPRQWLEIIQTAQELAGKPGILVRLQRVSGNKLIIDLASIKEASGLKLPDKFDQNDESESRFFKIRLWDYTIDTGEAGISINADNDSGYISLEGEGIEVKFEGKGHYQTGDYWLIPTRKNSRNPLDWPTNEDDSSSYQALPPNGIKHYYSPLAKINFTENNLNVVEDLRKSFPSLINCLDGTDFTINNLRVQDQITETRGKGTIASNSEDPDDVTVNYFGDGFADLSVGDSIVAQGQARTIQSLDSQRLRLTVNQPFNPVLEESEPGKGQEFSSQKSLVHFSYPGEATQLIFNSLGLEVKGKIKTEDLELSTEGTFETGTFKGQSLELGIRQEDSNTFLTYGLIQAEEVGGSKQISFTADSDVRFAFLKTQDEATPPKPLIVIDGIVDATDFWLDGTRWILDTERICNGAITTEKLNNNAVTTEKLNNNAVTTEKLNNNAVTTEKLNNNAVTTEKLNNNAVTTEKLNNNAVTTEKLNNNAVTAEKLNNNAVTAEKLNNNAVTAEKLRADTSNNQQRAVTTNHIRNGAVTLDKLANSIRSNLSKWSDGDNGSIYYDNGNVALGTDQATASLQVQGSELETALGTISSNHLVTVTGNETTFATIQQGSWIIAANEIRRITRFISTTKVIVDLPFSESLSAENFAVVPVQDVTISPSSSSQTTININGDIPTELSENDIIIAAGQIRTVLTVTESSNEESINEFTIDIPFKEPLQDSTPFAILQPEANITVSGWDEQTQRWNRAIARVEGELPSNLVATGDFIIAAGQLRMVEAIDGTNSSFTVTPPFREPLPLDTNLFILSQESGTITTEITVTGDANVDFDKLHIGDVLSVETATTRQTRLIIGKSPNDNKLNISTPFDSSLTDAAFFYQQPIARFVDSNQQTQLIINAEGNVGIGTSIPTVKLQVDGSVRINDDLWCKGSLLQSSSLTLKTNIAELSRQEANQILRELNPIKFNYKEDRLNHHHIGFIAEDVPDLVASSDKKAICPVDILAVLTKNVQDHQQTITQLTNLVEEQKHEIAVLQENLTRLSELLQKKDRAQKRRRFRILAWLKRSLAQVTLLNR